MYSATHLLVYDQSLKNSECAGFGLLPRISIKPARGGTLAKDVLSVMNWPTSTSGLRTFTDATKELQDKTVTVDDGGIALLAFQHGRLQEASMSPATA